LILTTGRDKNRNGKQAARFLEEKLNKVRVKRTTSKLLEVVLEEKRREIIKYYRY